MSTATTSVEWLSTAAAAKALLVSQDTVQKLIKERLLTTRQLPGHRIVRVSAESVKQLAADSVTPSRRATAQAS